MSSNNHQTVLLVENDLAMRQLYERELAKEFRVLSVSMEQIAFDDICFDELDAAVVGLDTRFKQSYQILEKINLKTKNFSIPLIVYSSLEERRSEVLISITAYLVQPVLPSTLLQEVMQSVLSTPGSNSTRRR